MTDPDVTDLLAAARESLSRPLSFEEMLAKLPTRDRLNAERRAAALDASAFPYRAVAWRRLACALMTLAPIAKFVGRDGVEFFVPDGRYRMQVFALEDVQDGNLTVYCPDVLPEAVSAGLLVPTGLPEPRGYAVTATGEDLEVTLLDGAGPSPDAHAKNLTNWKRRALKVTLAPNPSAAQVGVAELVCALAARHFIPPASPPVAGG